jgi:hypothetical protein
VDLSCANLDQYQCLAGAAKYQEINTKKYAKVARIYACWLT